MPSSPDDAARRGAAAQRRGLDPDLSGERRSGDELELLLRVPEDLEVWPGHFPDFFVVPGVLQLDWVMRIARERLGVESLARIDAMKFASPMRPGQCCTLTLALDRERAALAFRMEHAGTVYSSGRLRVAVREP